MATPAALPDSGDNSTDAPAPSTRSSPADLAAARCMLDAIIPATDIRGTLAFAGRVGRHCIPSTRAGDLGRREHTERLR
ncbi:MAG: hypothetical protein ABIZ57_03205 [Candidatus Limnocylindria bacterium]